MGQILGEGFNSYVREQIKLRQEKLALRDKDPELLRYLTSKTSFLRLTSGVDITSNDKLQKLGLSATGINVGADLAKQFVISSAYFDGEFTSGVGYNLKSSYGFSSNSDYGYSPPPGIISSTIRYMNRGSLKEATIELICHNLIQFKIIDALFLKLRYSLLLEWGHTLYYNQNGVLSDSNNIPNLSPSFLNGDFKSQRSLLDKIEENRLTTNGNYDAFLGVVKNFNWELMENGSYKITINAIATGDVIESLKINSNVEPNKTTEGPTDEFKKSTLHRLLGEVKRKIDGNNPSGYAHGYGNFIALNSPTLEGSTGIKASHLVSGDNSSTSSPSSILASNEGISCFFNGLELESGQTSTTQYYIKLGALLRIIQAFNLYYDTDKGGNPPVFNIDFDFDDNKCLTIPNQASLDPRICVIPFDNDNRLFNRASSQLPPPQAPPKNYKKQTITETYKRREDPSLAFVTWEIVNKTVDEVDASDNLGIPTGSRQITSYDASTAGGGSAPVDSGLRSNIGRNLTSTESTVFYLGTPPDDDNYRLSIVTIQFNEIITVPPPTAPPTEGALKRIGKEFRSGKPLVGNMMHIYINIDYATSTLDKNVDKNTGQISLFDFLKNLLNGVQKVLGYINDFEVIYNSDNNVYHILDNAYVPYKNNTGAPTLTEFNINKLTSSNGSIVKNFGFKTEIPAKLSTTIAIGAQSNGSTLISNSTPISDMNSGIADRVILKKRNKNVSESANEDFSRQYVTAYGNYMQFLHDVYSGAGKATGQDIDSKIKANSDLLQYDISYYTKQKNLPGTEFIPLNLNLTIDGLGGIKMYQMFKVNEDILTKEYSNKIAFLVKGLSHKIDSKGWETHIETMGVPKTTINSSLKQPSNPVTVTRNENNNVVVSGNSNYDLFLSLDSTTPQTSPYLFGAPISSVLTGNGKPASIPTSAAHGGRPGVGNNWESNNAWDIFVRPGTPVYAVYSGTVFYVRRRTQPPFVWGTQTTIGTSSTKAFYTHLDHVVVSQGQSVVKGQLIGFVGEFAGHAPNAHFHHLHMGLFDKARHPGDSENGPWNARLKDAVDSTGKLIY